MASMIEKISRALFIEESQDPDRMFGGGLGWKVYEHLSLAALKAIREKVDDYEISRTGKSEIYAIIDEALKEGEE